MESKVVLSQDANPEALGGGVSRRVLAYLPSQMIVEVTFEMGAIGTVHTHPHTQCTYVRQGEFVFTLCGKEYTVCAGDTLAFAPGEPHGCVCRQAGVLIDVFTPMREDFIH
ncbi:MAG TPA: cupin domain-containing protein [Candidatus Limiplasma sp.]|nr:cupin domain-containing protein [Candidatus Limiplasma sp.]HPS80484.1 cupin domain-containing protein [Candidatus Limiplasma sp.]